MTRPLVDANVLLRHIIRDEPSQSPRATSFLDRSDENAPSIEFTTPVLFEVVYTLESYHKQSKESVRDAVGLLLQLPSAEVAERASLRQALDVHARFNISIVDAYLAVEATRHNVPVVSFDRGFDRIPGVQRIEP